MEQQSKTKVEELLQHVTEYVDQRKDLVILEVTEKSSKIMAHMAGNALIFSLSGFILLFTSIGGAWFIGQALNNMPMGFISIAGFYLFTLLIVLLINKNILRSTLTNYFIKKFLYDSHRD